MRCADWEVVGGNLLCYLAVNIYDMISANVHSKHMHDFERPLVSNAVSFENQMIMN